MVSKRRLQARFEQDLQDVKVVKGIQTATGGDDWVVDFRLPNGASRGYTRSTFRVNGDFVTGGSIRFADVRHVYDGERHSPAYFDDPVAAMRDCARKMAEVYQAADPPPTHRVYWQISPDQQQLGITPDEYRERGFGSYNDVSQNEAASGAVFIRINDPTGGIHPHFDLRDNGGGEPDWMIGRAVNFTKRAAEEFLDVYPDAADL